MQTRENPAPCGRASCDAGDVKSFETAVTEWVRAKVATGLAGLR